MGRAPCCEKVGLKRGRWTTEEDEILMKYIEANGEGSWRSLPKNAGLLRCGKSCRLRWINYLRTDVKRGNITSEEEDTIVKLHTSLGNRWSLIAAHLPGRTDNEIKNYWNSRLSRRIHCFRRRHGNENLPPILMDLTKFGSSGGFKQRKGGRTARHAMKKKSIYKIDATVAAMTSVEKKTVKSVADSEIGVDNPSCEAAGGQGVETELMGVNGGIMGEEEALDTDGILINFDEVMVAVDQQRERHDEELELGWNKETNEEMDEQDWADWDWNAIAAAASSGGGGVAVAADDIHSSSSGTGMLAQDGEEILSWLWEDDDDELERAGTTSVEDCEQQQQALAAWLLS